MQPAEYSMALSWDSASFALPARATGASVPMAHIAHPEEIQAGLDSVRVIEGPSERTRNPEPASCILVLSNPDRCLQKVLQNCLPSVRKKVPSYMVCFFSSWLYLRLSALTFPFWAWLYKTGRIFSWGIWNISVFLCGKLKLYQRKLELSFIKRKGNSIYWFSRFSSLVFINPLK